MTIQPNSPYAWWLAIRPKTLSGALVSVATAAALAFSGELPLNRGAGLLAVLCALFAALMQIASNFINDLVDFQRGTDREDRLGPKRACQQGWISPHAMRMGIAAVVGSAAMIGTLILLLLLIVSPCSTRFLIGSLCSVGISCMLGAFLYTTTLSKRGLGDVMVILFFGIIPVCTTFFVLTNCVTLSSLWLGIGVGLMVDTLLVVNNFRDRDTDRAVGKRTLIVRIGEKRGAQLYFLLGWAALFCVVLASYFERSVFALPCLAVMIPHYFSWKKLVRIHHGKALNVLLGESSRNILLFALALIIGTYLNSFLK